MEDVTDIMERYSKSNSVNGRELSVKLKGGTLWTPQERRFLTKAIGRNLMKTCVM